MNCRVCNQPLSHLLTYENMPGRAQNLHDTPIDDSVTLDLCQCRGCGLVQLANEPVSYWREQIRTDTKRVKELSEGVDFVSCNYLEHVPNPNEYLAQFDGRGVVEVPNFDMILRESLFAEIMLDHLMYFATDTLRFTLQYNGFEVVRIAPTFHDYVLSALVERRMPYCLWEFDEAQKELKCELDSFISRYGSVVIYGASHQAFAIIAMCKPAVDFVIDDAPFKQGKYTPVGGIPIVNRSFLEGADAVIVIGGGYSDEILQGLKFDGGVAVVRPSGLEVIK